MKQKRNLLEFFIILLFLGLGFINPANIYDTIFGLVLLSLVGLVSTNNLAKIFSKPFFQIVPFIFFFIASSFILGQSITSYLSHEPLVETYRSDLDDFLRTYYLMEQGNNYYAAFSQAVAENAFKGYVAHNLFAWRLPTIFYIWKWLPGISGVSIFYAFIGISISIFVSVYYLARNLLETQKKHLAILAPYLIYSYLHFGVRDTWILHTEWWALAPFLWGIYFLVKRKNFLAASFILLAIIIRELFIIPLVFLSALLFLYKKEQWKIGLYCGIILIIYMGVHAYFVNQISGTTNSLLNGRTHFINGDIIKSSLAFGTGEYLFYRLRIFIVFIVCAILGIFMSKNVWSKILLAFLLFPLTFLFIGSSVYNDYWGIFYVPFSVVGVPLFISRIK